MTGLTLNPPTPHMLDDKDSMYKFLLEIWERSGGYVASDTDLTGLTVSVPELNMLEGVRLDESVQAQLNSKASTGNLGTMAFQNANNVNITSGELAQVSISDSNINNVAIVNSSISNTEITLLTGSALVATTGGTIGTNTTTVGNVGAAETDLLIFNLIANTLNENNNYIEILGFGTLAANANNKRIRLNIGTTTIYDTTALAMNNGSWKIHATIIRTAANAQKCIVEVSSSNALLTNSVAYLVSAEDFTTGFNISFTGTAVADNDIVQEGLIIKYYKG